MKKFLFTLAAMFMVTSAFAASYLYIDANDFTVTKADIENGTEIEIPVRAYFFARVSGWDFEITNLPAGMTFTFAEKGASFDVTTKNARGRDQVVSATLYGAEEPFLHMLAVQGEVGYWQDPNGENPTAWVSYGVTKWEGGEYDEMLLMYAVFDSTYHGGKIESVTAVSSGRDSRGNTVTDYPGEQSTFWPNPEEGSVFPDPDPTPQEDPADAPVIDFTEDASGVMITIENYTECVIKVDGEVVATEAPYYVEKIYDAAQAIEVYAKNAPEGFIPAEDTKTYNLPEKQKEQTSKPSVTYSYDNGELTVWAYGCTEENVEYTLYCDGVEYTGEMPIAYDIYEGYNHVWTATALAPNCLVSDMSDECPIVIDAVVPEYQTPDPVITVNDDPEAEVVTITVTGEGTVTIVVTKMNDDPEMTGEVVYETSGESPLTYEIPYGEVEAYYSVYATATADMPGYDVIPADATEPFIVVPAKTPEQTEKPVITYTEVENGVEVTATGNGHICLYVEDMLVAEGEGTASYVIESTELEEEYGVSATAQEDGKLVSDPAVETVYVPAETPDPVLSSEPIITFVETTEDGKVVAVEVVVENYDSYQIYVNDELLRGTVINASTEEAKVIRVVATNDDDDEAPAYLPNTIERTYTLNKLEQEELEKTDAPSIAANAHMGNIYDEDGNLVEEHHGYYQVVVTETEAGSDLEYRVKFNDGEWSDWMPYSEAVNFDVEGNYVVEARAKVDGKDYSDPVTVSFSVTATTGLELLNGEKAVAGVRYFNVAGQEMQEANGVTIVVTTYTDGSVTAVKVMK